MPENYDRNNERLVTQEILKIAKRKLKPSTKNRNEITQSWRFELTQKNIRTISIILIFFIFLSGLVWWDSRIIGDENITLTIEATESVETPNQQEVAVSEVVVYVSGDVAKTGVYKLPSGSRVIDALNQAGGLTKNGQIGENNLARLLADGEHVDFSKYNPNTNNSKVKNSNKSRGCINLNTAQLSQLDTLPGVGPVLAQRIIDWREANGNFKSVEQLSEVGGIGKSKFSTISVKTCV